MPGDVNASNKIFIVTVILVFDFELFIGGRYQFVSCCSFTTMNLFLRELSARSFGLRRVFIS
jgi:hypothetical protein